jgi:hypothetical protein
VRHERNFFNEVGDVRLKEEVKSETPSGEWIIVFTHSQELTHLLLCRIAGTNATLRRIAEKVF